MPSLSARNHKLRYEDGGAIIAALWLSLILALLAIGLIAMSRNSLLEVKTKAKLEAVWLKAEGGISIAKYNIAKRQERWGPREAAYSAKIGEDNIDIYITSPRGKADINFASPALLSQIFVSLGYEADRSARMADRIADWRDEDDLIRLNGAEKVDYQLAGQNAGPANAPFEDIAHIGHVLGMDGTGCGCLSPFLTIYSQSAAIEPENVSGVLRSLLALPERSENPVIGFRRSSLAGQVFEVTADISYSDKAKARVIEVFRYTGIPSDPVWIHTQMRTIVDTDDIPRFEIPKACPSQIENTGK